MNSSFINLINNTNNTTNNTTNVNDINTNYYKCLKQCKQEYEDTSSKYYNCFIYNTDCILLCKSKKKKILDNE
jgi:hypothetical protein